MPWKTRTHGSSSQRGQTFYSGEDPKVEARRNAITRRRGGVQGDEFRKLEMKRSVLRPVFERYVDKQDWKAPIDAVVPSRQEANLLADAIEFFHGAEAEVSEIDVAVPIHGGGLVHVPRTAFRVVSEGYV